MAVRARAVVPSMAKPILAAKFNAVKVFSATMFAQRDRLGDDVTAWIAANPTVTINEIIVTQSSDEQYHCVSFSVFYTSNG